MTQWIVIILTAIIAAAAVLAVLYSRRSARENKRLADVSEKEHELRTRPVVSFDIGWKKSNARGVEIQFKFSNVGDTAVKLKELVFTWWFTNRPEEQHSINRTLDRTIHRPESWEHEIQFHEHEFRQHQIEEAKALEGAHFYGLISGIFELEFLDTRDKLWREQKPIERLM